MKDVLLAVLAFALTWAEVFVCIRGGRADRQSTYSRGHRKSLEASFYTVAHDLIIAGYTVLIVRESLWLTVPVAAAGFLATYRELERRRKKWWSNAGKRQKRKQKLDKVADPS